jgi:hypothetical protein
MAKFSLEELKEINRNLAELLCAYVRYDAKIARQTEMELGKREKRITKKSSTDTIQNQKGMFYVR